VSGRLTVVGTGIQPVAQTSAETVAFIQGADNVFFVSADLLTEPWIKQLNPSCESLNALYVPGRDRRETYELMVKRVVDSVASGSNVCFVVYGHPGVFADPAHEAIRRVRAMGLEAEMLPAISADACLFADLGIDPGDTGCQSYEATDFLIHRRRYDPRSALVLWQIGVIAERGFKSDMRAWNPSGVIVLVEVLLEQYPPDHVVTIYEAARYPRGKPLIFNVQLAKLADAPISSICTLYVPPYGEAAYDETILERLSALR
jgi:uncharacterized protein YabN with tetrapyrrole methylase and pyrophosphatase domain